jgi:hypothetical protein
MCLFIKQIRDLCLATTYIALQQWYYTSAIPYIDVFTNYSLSVSKKWAGGCLVDIIKIVIHFLMKCRMSEGHRANAANVIRRMDELSGVLAKITI